MTSRKVRVFLLILLLVLSVGLLFYAKNHTDNELINQFFLKSVSLDNLVLIFFVIKDDKTCTG